MRSGRLLQECPLRLRARYLANSDEVLTGDRGLQQVAGGNRNRDIARKLFITEETVKLHIKHIMEKLGATDRTQAVAIGLAEELSTLDTPPPVR